MGRYAAVVSAETFVLERRKTLTVVRASVLDVEGVDVVITTRHGGVSRGAYASFNLGDHVGDDASAVAHNRGLLADAMNVATDELIFARQVHGANVVDADVAASGDEGDIMVLRGRQRAGAILVADCVPLVIVSASTHALALVHAGWRGLANGAVEVALRAIGAPSDVAVAVGPSISLAAYQVGPEVANHFRNVPGALLGDVADRSRLDLRRVLVHQLESLGVDPARIYLHDASTDDASTYFSDRAQRPCGRFAMAAKWSS